MEQTLIIFKPDAVNRGIVGEILHRFERKGMKIVGLKMMQLTDEILNIHYKHHLDKDWFSNYKKFMKSAPALLVILEGLNTVEVVRKMAGPTHGAEAPPGTIRGDYSLSQGYNIVHAADSLEIAKEEIERFFKKEEIFPYEKVDWSMIYSEEERK